MDFQNLLPFPTGEFLPGPLQLSIKIPERKSAADLPKEILKEIVEITFLHEYAHFLQAFGTTYEHNRWLDALNWIADTVSQLGGADRVMNGLSTQRADYVRHMVFHRNSCDGRYGSRELSMVGGNVGAHGLTYNRDMHCWEYLRRSPASNNSMVTPLGAHAFEEGLVYINEILHSVGGSDKDTVITESFLETPESELHSYYAAVELFLRSCERRPDSTRDKLVSLAALLDLALQIPSTEFEGHPDWPAISNPTHRFKIALCYFLEKSYPMLAFGDVKSSFATYQDELCKALDWPIITPGLNRWRETFTSIVDDLLQQIDSQVVDDAEHEVLLLQELIMADVSLEEGDKGEVLQYLFQIPSAEAALYAALFGPGLLNQAIRTLEHRSQKPWVVALPSLDLENCIEALPIPKVTVGNAPLLYLAPHNVGLLVDMIRFNHLWALAWQAHLRRPMHAYECGYRWAQGSCGMRQCHGGDVTACGRQPSSSFFHVLRWLNLGESMTTGAPP